MADFTNPNASVADMATGNPGINMGTTGSMRHTEYASDELWGQSASAWHDVKDATRDAWDHVRSTTARSTTTR